MDRAIDNTAKRRARWIAVAAGLAAIIAALYFAISHFSVARLSVDKEKLMIDTVDRGIFQEAIVLDGQIMPPAPKNLAIEDGNHGFDVRVEVGPRDASTTARVLPGQRAETRIGDTTHEGRVSRVGPTAPGGVQIDLRFEGRPPADPGLTVPVRLSFGKPAEALLLDRGGFFQATGGHWVFVVDEAAGTASRRTVRLGRQNPESYEVLSGLEAGERVITSSYDLFGDVEEVVFEP